MRFPDIVATCGQEFGYPSAFNHAIEAGSREVGMTRVNIISLIADFEGDAIADDKQDRATNAQEPFTRYFIHGLACFHFG